MMLDIINYQGIANKYQMWKNYMPTEVLKLKWLMIPSIGEDAEQLKLSDMASWSIKYYHQVGYFFDSMY